MNFRHAVVFCGMIICGEQKVCKLISQLVDTGEFDGMVMSAACRPVVLPPPPAAIEAGGASSNTADSATTANSPSL